MKRSVKRTQSNGIVVNGHWHPKPGPDPQAPWDFSSDESARQRLLDFLDWFMDLDFEALPECCLRALLLVDRPLEGPDGAAATLLRWKSE